MNKQEDRPYQQCRRCVMDTTASDIKFDEEGICNFCTEFIKNSSNVIYEDPLEKEERLKELVEQVK